MNARGDRRGRIKDDLCGLPLLHQGVCLGLCRDSRELAAWLLPRKGRKNHGQRSPTAGRGGQNDLINVAWYTKHEHLAQKWPLRKIEDKSLIKIKSDFGIYHFRIVFGDDFGLQLGGQK